MKDWKPILAGSEHYLKNDSIEDFIAARLNDENIVLE